MVRPAADKSLRLQPATAAAPGPFVTPPAAAPVEFTAAATAKIDAVLAELIWDFGTETKLADGDAPALFAAQPDRAACDVTAMAQSLAARSAVAAAFAAPLRIAPNQIAGYLGTLAPLALAHDTVVVNHDYVDGDAAAVNSVLQAGTPVLVTPPELPGSGVPAPARWRCRTAPATPISSCSELLGPVTLSTKCWSSSRPLRSPPFRWWTRPAASSSRSPSGAATVPRPPRVRCVRCRSRSSFADRLVAVTKTPDTVTCADMKQRWAEYDGWVQTVREGVGLVFTFGDNWTCTSRTNAQLSSPTWSGTVGSCSARNGDEGAFTVYSADRYDPATGTSSAAAPSGSGAATGTAAPSAAAPTDGAHRRPRARAGTTTRRSGRPGRRRPGVEHRDDQARL